MFRPSSIEGRFVIIVESRSRRISFRSFSFSNISFLCLKQPWQLTPDAKPPLVCTNNHRSSPPPLPPSPSDRTGTVLRFGHRSNVFITKLPDVGRECLLTSIPPSISRADGRGAWLGVSSRLILKSKTQPPMRNYSVFLKERWRPAFLLFGDSCVGIGGFFSSCSSFFYPKELGRFCFFLLFAFCTSKKTIVDDERYTTRTPKDWRTNL